MLRVLKNLKNSFISVVFIVLLLFVQAQADLKLPDYTSKIVNTGIHRGISRRRNVQRLGSERCAGILDTPRRGSRAEHHQPPRRPPRCSRRGLHSRGSRG